MFDTMFSMQQEVRERPLSAVFGCMQKRYAHVSWSCKLSNTTVFILRRAAQAVFRGAASARALQAHCDPLRTMAASTWWSGMRGVGGQLAWQA